CYDPAHIHANFETQEVAVELPALVKCAAFDVWDDPPDGLGRPRPVGRGSGGSLLLQEPHDLRPSALEASACSLQHARSHAFAFANEPEQNVLGANRVMPQTLGFFLSQNDRAAGAIREPLEHGDTISSPPGPPLGGQPL